jgi:hypothetical protein
MSLAFLGFLPFAIGFITIFVVERREPHPVWIWLLLPWVPVLGASFATIAAFWEGFICVMMFAPIGLVCASFGGVLAGLVQKVPRSLLAKNAGLACVVLLPGLTTSWVQKLLTRQELRKVENVIDVDAPSSMVWKNIERVPRIYPNELRPSWSHRIGFPSPVEATLSFEGVGGVRHASFERGLLFIETVDAWEPERRLAFSMHAQTDQISPPDSG